MFDWIRKIKGTKSQINIDDKCPNDQSKMILNQKVQINEKFRDKYVYLVCTKCGFERRGNNDTI